MKTEEKQTLVSKCHRTIDWLGKVEEITVDKHSFAWSGKIPCTGMRRCIYCGQYEQDLANNMS